MRILLLSLILFVGCEKKTEQRVVQAPKLRVIATVVPVEIRQRNYAQGGSCVFASAVTMFRYHGYDEVASWTRRNNSGAGYVVDDIARICQKFKIGYRSERRGNVAFLEWVSQNRRVAIVNMPATRKYGHAINFIGFNKGWAVLIDNNNPNRRQYIPKREFLNQWRGYGIALTELPPLPKPWR